MRKRATTYRILRLGGPPLEDYRSERLSRAGIWLFVSLTVLVPGGLLVAAGLSEDDHSAYGGGLLLIGSASPMLLAAGWMLYRRARRPTAERILVEYIGQRVGVGVIAGLMGLAGLVIAGISNPWTDDDPDILVTFGATLAFVVMMGWLAVAVLRKARRQWRQLRVLAAMPPGTGVRRRIVEWDRNDFLNLWVIVEGESGPVVVPLIPWQDRTGLVGADGLTEMSGDVRAGEMVILRNGAGAPIWPSDAAWSLSDGHPLRV